MSNTTLTLILEKVASKDKDFRYMATSDLLQELKKETCRMDHDMEKRICRVVLQQMQDSSGDISGLAVKCLAALVPQITEAHVGEVSESLCEKIVSEKKDDAEQRDISSIGLKTLIGYVNSEHAADTVMKLVTPKLLKGMYSEDAEVMIESLEIMRELVMRFGPQLGSQAVEIKDRLLPKLDEKRPVVRKKSIQCLGALAFHLPDGPLNLLIQHLLMQLQPGKASPSLASAYVQAVGAVSRAVGGRFGQHLEAAVPLVIGLLSSSKEGQEELMECCLHTLEGFVQRCSLESQMFVDEILDTALQYLRHDPNFADDYADDMEEDEYLEEEEEEDNEEEYSDDEDESWKVRRAATKCLSALFLARGDGIGPIYAKAGARLVARFCEREENVKLDVFHAYIDMLHQVANAARTCDPNQPDSPASLLLNDVPSLMKAIGKQLKEKSLKTRVGVFTVLHQLAVVAPHSTVGHIPALILGLQKGLLDKASSADLKIEILTFLQLAMANNPPATFQPFLIHLSEAVFTAVKERYYKVTAKALRVCEEMVRVLRADQDCDVPSELQHLVHSLFDCTMGRLGAQDQDQEVKECAIRCVAKEICVLGDHLADKVPEVLEVLLDRLRNETTRLTTVKAFTVIASSHLELDLSAVVKPVLAELTSFLRKANMALRQASLTTLEALCSRMGDSLSSNSLVKTIEEGALLAEDRDLPLAAHSLSMFCVMLGSQPTTASYIAEKVLPRALALARSPLLQGSALDSLKNFLAMLVPTNAPNAQFDALFKDLMAAGMGAESAGKVQQLSVAQCVARLTHAAGPSVLSSTLATLLQTCRQEGTAGSQRLALLCIGEIGRHTDLSSFGDVMTVLAEAMASPFEDVKSASPMALGAVSVGNLPLYLPRLLQQITTEAQHPKQVYLLLQALTEVIKSLHNREEMEVAAEPILDVLLKSAESEEECRNVAAECLGHLVLLQPTSVLPVLDQKISAPSANMRCMIASCMKFGIVDRPHPVDATLRSSLPMYLGLIRDDDRNVRKAAVQTLSAALHHKINLVEEHLPQLLPLLYQQTQIREDLIRVVNLGPFKHKVDDGLELRKASFECMDLMLHACPHKLNTRDFSGRLLSGLADEYDIRLLCHSMLSKLATLAPGAVLAALEQIIGPLQKTLNAKLKSDAVKQEVDRHEDLIRSCLRAVDAVNRIPGSSTTPAFKRFFDQDVMKGEMKNRFSQIEKERVEAEGSSSLEWPPSFMLDKI